MSGETIQGLWVGSRLRRTERLSIASFLANGHPYDLYVYEDVAGVPAGARLRDAGEILPASLVRRDPLHGGLAMFSDLFRYRLLLERGGVWADLDMICLRALDLREPWAFASFRETDGRIHRAGGILKAPAGAPAIAFCHDCTLRREGRLDRFSEVGPLLVGEAVARFGLGRYVHPPGAFVPVDWWRWRDLASDRVAAGVRCAIRTFGSRTVHLWHDLWRRDGRDLDEPFPRRSFLARLERRFSGAPGAA